MIKLSVIVPCYNESASLPNLFSACRNAVGDRDFVEFIFVNNGSKDDSEIVFERLLGEAQNAFARVVNIPVNQGYGYGILQGLYQSKGEIISWTHADLQTDPCDVIIAYEKFTQELISNQSIIKGKRKGRNFMDAFFTTGMSLVSSVLLKTWLSDVNAQPKMFNRAFLSELEQAPFDFSLDLYLLYIAKKRGLALESFPVYFKKRDFGEAKGGGTFKGKIKLIRRTFSFILKLRRSLKKTK